MRLSPTFIRRCREGESLVEKCARNSHRLNYMMLHGLYFDIWFILLWNQFYAGHYSIYKNVWIFSELRSDAAPLAYKVATLHKSRCWHSIWSRSTHSLYARAIAQVEIALSCFPFCIFNLRLYIHATFGNAFEVVIKTRLTYKSYTSTSVIKKVLVNNKLKE